MTELLEVQPTRAALSALLDRCAAVDGVEPFSGHVLSSLDHPSATRYFCSFHNGALVGAAVLPGHDPAELAVDPGYRRRGVGGALLNATLEVAGRVWAHGNTPGAQHLAQQRGLAITRELMQLRRNLAQLPPVVWPDGVRVRTFVPGVDDTELLAVNARAFDWHPEQGRLDQEGLQIEMEQDWFDPAGLFLAVGTDNRVLGFHWTKVHAFDPTPGTGPVRAVGEVYVIGVDPRSKIRGLGAPLSLAGMHYLQERALGSVMLYVEGDNGKALRLYERLGFQRYLTDVVYSRR